MKKKINVRLIWIAILAVLAATVSITIIYYGLFKKQVRNDLRLQAELLRDTGVLQSTEQELHLDNDELRITWIDENGVVLYDNDTDAALLSNHADRPEVQEALKEGVGESVRLSDTMGMNTFYYAILLEDGTVLRVAIEAKNIFSIFISSFPAIIILMLVIIAVCTLLAHLLTKQLIEPIDTLAENIGDSTKVPVYRELVPFVDTIRAQHENILAAVKSRQDFTANVSHELKTPLTAISGYAELIENRMVNPEQEAHFASEIRQNADRLLSLINDIIRLSELDQSDLTDEFEEFNLFQLVREDIEALRLNANKQGIRLTFEGEPCMIRGNKDMIRELLDNLCQNAIRYNTPNGTVLVEVWKERGKPTLTVSDTGVGIPKDQQERVFERFYRVDKSRSKATGGTGLGLAIVKHIVELHGADILLESEVGRGTVIRVTF